MTTLLFRLLAAVALGLGLSLSAAIAQPSLRGHDAEPPVPANLEVPAGHSLHFVGHATGTQNYVCLPSANGPAWTFMAPQATLYHQIWGHLYQQAATHFLAANPLEGGVPRPSWQHSLDSSQVWGRAIASSNDPAYVEPGAIPWLLLEVVGASQGPTGGSLLANTTYIQRLNTSGGLAATGPCAEIGAIALVPYRADYYFYRANRRR